MSLILTLPNLDGAKIIVIDEGDEVKYAESLITAWLPLWRGKEGRSIDLFLFSSSKNSSKIYQNSCLRGGEIKVHDYYSLSLEKADPLENEKPWDIPDINSLKQNSVVLIDSLSSLLIYKGLSWTCKFIEKLSLKVSQIVCIYQRDFTPKKIPAVNTFGTSYVRLESTRSLKTEQNLLTYKTLSSHCKPGGGILQRIEIVEQNIDSYEIRIEKATLNSGEKSNNKKSAKPETTEKIQASFRIEMNDREIEQRNATPLPYTLNTLTLSESKIHYEPDETDDLDEEDPDDDLDF